MRWVNIGCHARLTGMPWNGLARPWPAGRVIESVRSRLNRRTMRDPPVSSRGGRMALGRRCRSERSDDPAHGYVPRARGRFITQLTSRPTRPSRIAHDDVRVVRPAQVNRVVCTILRKYEGRRRRLDDMRIFPAGNHRVVSREIYIAATSGFSRARAARMADIKQDVALLLSLLLLLLFCSRRGRF